MNSNAQRAVLFGRNILDLMGLQDDGTIQPSFGNFHADFDFMHFPADRALNLFCQLQTLARLPPMRPIIMPMPPPSSGTSNMTVCVAHVRFRG
jgi:hypothetical protein